MTDLEKFKAFLRELNIGYNLSKNVIYINEDSIIHEKDSYGKDLDIRFSEGGDFIGFDPCGE